MKQNIVCKNFNSTKHHEFVTIKKNYLRKYTHYKSSKSLHYMKKLKNLKTCLSEIINFIKILWS